MHLWVQFSCLVLSYVKQKESVWSLVETSLELKACGRLFPQLFSHGYLGCFSHPNWDIGVSNLKAVSQQIRF